MKQVGFSDIDIMDGSKTRWGETWTLEDATIQREGKNRAQTIFEWPDDRIAVRQESGLPGTYTTITFYRKRAAHDSAD